ncbi:MAG: hypothetical protein JNJ58_06330 [Chitinophagaceae bacterium]|nr:hypothetical protein [Chitinophagaceae bacterium]
MKTKLLAPTGILLILAIGNFIRLNANSQIRMVDFLAIFSIGALATFFIIQIILFLNAKKNSNA